MTAVACFAGWNADPRARCGRHRARCRLRGLRVLVADRRCGGFARKTGGVGVWSDGVVALPRGWRRTTRRATSSSSIGDSSRTSIRSPTAIAHARDLRRCHRRTERLEPSLDGGTARGRRVRDVRARAATDPGGDHGFSRGAPGIRAGDRTGSACRNATARPMPKPSRWSRTRSRKARRAPGYPPRTRVMPTGWRDSTASRKGAGVGASGISRSRSTLRRKLRGEVEPGDLCAGFRAEKPAR